MKRLLLCLLALSLLSASALAEGYNSFLDDKYNAGSFDQFVWDGRYVYWLGAPEDGGAEDPANIYRMRPGGMGAETVLEGRTDLRVQSMLNIGGRLLLKVERSDSDACMPALLNLEDGDYQELSGNIGSCVLSQGVLFNSSDGQIYRIPTDSMKPQSIYVYSEELAQQNPVLRQVADGWLYFSTDEPAWYGLNLSGGKLQRIASVRGDGFVVNGMLYISDYDALDGTWKYDVDTGNRVKVSECIYTFKQGQNGFVRAVGDDEDSWFQGCILDFNRAASNIEDLRVGECDENYDILLGGKLLHYDWQQNRVDWSEEDVAKRVE